MNISSKRVGVGIQVAIMAASIAVFLGGVSLVGGGFEGRGASFWVTVVSIVFAQLVLFNVPIWMMASDARNKDSFPFQFTAISFCTLYAAGVFLMALLVAAVRPGSGWVYFGHMILLFLLAASLGVYSMANRAIESMDQADRAAKAGSANLNLQVKSVQDRATLCEVAGVEPAQAAVAELVDAMHYATGESLPGSEAVDAEISSGFEVIELALVALDDADGEDAVADLVARISRAAKSAKLAISRRETLMKTLR
jgi:hypothetical protein